MPDNPDLRRLLSAVIAAHATSTSAAPWAQPGERLAAIGAQQARLVALRAAHAWAEPDADPYTPAGYRLAHHFVEDGGAVGAASTEAALAGIAELNGPACPVPGDQRAGVYGHLAKHLADAAAHGWATDVPPLAAQPAGYSRHGSYSGSHTHEHAAMGAQGDDATHSHEHLHSDDGNHAHDHAAANAVAADAGPEALTASLVAGLQASLVASGSRWGIQQNEGTWVVVGHQGEVARYTDDDNPRRAASQALARLGELAAAEDKPSSAGAFRAELIPEGVETSDGRMIAEKATKWSRLKTQGTLPLMLQTVTDVGHYGAVLAGRFTAVSRDGTTVVGGGDFDDTDAGHDFAEIVNARGRFGISVDLLETESDFECTELDEDGWCIDGLLTVTACELGGATGTPFPAFAEAFIESAEQAAANAVAAAAQPAAARPCRTCSEDAIVAAIPAEPPADWYREPTEQELADMVGSIAVADDGRVYGWAARWGTCHVGFVDVCVTPPQSASGYANFRLGSVRCSDGSEVPVGTITMGTGHAALSADPRAAAAHYDDTGTGVADVACGENAHGIWFAGGLRPTVTPDQVRALRASKISGDWRKLGGSLDLVAMLAVNVPGFPVPATRARVASGAQVALVAAGVVPDQPAPDLVAQRLDRLESALQHVQHVVNPLRTLARDAVLARVASLLPPEADGGADTEPEAAGDPALVG